MFPNQRLHLAPRSGFEQLGFSMRRGTPTADVRVRQAIAYAIDREEIVRMLLHGSPFRVHDSVLVAAHGRAFVPAWQQYRPDGARVQALLRDAGYELGEAGWSRDGAPLELSLRMSADKGMRSDLAQLLQQQLADVGIILRIRLEEGAVFEEQTLERGAFDLALWPVGIDSPHGLVQTLGCGRGGGRDNHGGYCDPRVDRLLHAAARSLDPRAQADAFARVQRLVAADVPVLPLYQQVAEVVHHRHVEGVVINPHGGAFWNVQDWRVPA